jgi:threonine/homoserine/homoserine lactone efflux protein
MDTMAEILTLIGLGAVAGLGIAVQPGAVSLLILDQSMRDVRHGVAAALGVALVDAVACALALISSAAVAGVLHQLGDGPSVLAGVLLIVVGVLGLRRRTAGESIGDRALPDRAAPGSLALTLTRFVALTATNPATVLYFLTFAVGVRAVAPEPLSVTMVMISAGVASLIWQLVLVLIGHGLGRTLRPRMRQTLRVSGALVVIVLGVGVVLGAVPA